MGKRAFFLIGVILMLTMTGCQTIPQEHEGAAKGAGIGAATGAVAGAVLGDGTEGALLGGLAGALIGGAVGHYTVDQERGAKETVQKYDYSPSEGVRLRIEEVAAVPQTVNPGEKVNLHTTYAVLTPSSDRSVEVTESYEILHSGEVVGSPQVIVNHRAGTYSSSVPLFLPQEAEEGIYTVTSTVSANGTSDSREFDFRVQ